MNQTEKKDHLLHFLNESPTAFHAAANIISFLSGKGFQRLAEDRRWDLQPGHRYFVSRGDSSVIAFMIPEQTAAAMPAKIAASHLDSPALKVKMKGLSVMQGIAVLPVEVYGGPILSTWLDRPLGLAGRLVYEDSGEIRTRLFARPDIAVVANPAFHLNRDVNTKGSVYNPQRQLNAVIGTDTEQFPADLLDIPEVALLDSELFLYDSMPAAEIGMRKELICASRLDNLLSAWTAMLAIAEASPSRNRLTVSYWADNEEIGNMTRQGAGSNFLESVFRRILCCFHASEEDHYISLAQSLMLSADAAHAANPNYMELYEPHYSPKLGQGIAIKKNARARYATTGNNAAEFRALCRKADIPCQDFTNRADMTCGSTVGPLLSASLGISTIDIGVPMLAMHSIRETADWRDVFRLEKAFSVFFQ